LETTSGTVNARLAGDGVEFANNTILTVDRSQHRLILTGRTHQTREKTRGSAESVSVTLRTRRQTGSRRRRAGRTLQTRSLSDRVLILASRTLDTIERAVAGSELAGLAASALRLANVRVEISGLA
jgi:hypothetical protein